MPNLPKPVPNNKIRLYCVGIFFYNDVDFIGDPTFAPGEFMSGGRILEMAAELYGLRYSLSKAGHVEFLSFTPTRTSPRRHTTVPGVPFPYDGLPLSLQEVQAPIGSISNIFQYTSDKPVKKPLDDQPSPQFATNGFAPGSEIRLRLLSIYDSASLYN